MTARLTEHRQQATAAHGSRRAGLLLVLTGAAVELLLTLGLVRPLWLWSHHTAIPTYEPLATVFGATWTGAGRFTAVLLLWLAGYGAALKLATGPLSRAARWALIWFPVLFAATLLLVLPVSSQDVYHYLIEGRVLALHGANPMVTPPSAFPDDPLIWTIGAWHNDPSPYGPVFALLAAGIAALAGNSLVAGVLGFKVLMTAALFGTAAVTAATLRRPNPERALAGYVFIAWNPLALYEAAVNAHNTWLMAFFLSLALWLTVARRSALALPVLALGALTKYVVGLAGPSLLIELTRARPTRRKTRTAPVEREDPSLQRTEGASGSITGRRGADRARQPAAISGKRRGLAWVRTGTGRRAAASPERGGEGLPVIALLIAAGLSALLCAALYAPFWAGIRTFSGAGTAADFILSSPGWLLRQALKHRLGWERAGDIAVAVCAAVFLAGWAVLLLRQWHEVRRPAAAGHAAMLRPARWVFAVMLWQLLTLSWALWPWYSLVLLPAAALLPGWQRRLTVLITATSLLAYIPINFAPAIWGPAPTDRMPLTVVLLMVGVPAVLVIAATVGAKRRARKPAT